MSSISCLETALLGDNVYIESCWVTASINVEHDDSFTIGTRLEFIYQQTAIVIAVIDEPVLESGTAIRLQYIVTTSGIRGWTWCSPTRSSTRLTSTWSRSRT